MPYALCDRNNETLHLEKCKYLMGNGSNSSCNGKNLNSVNESHGDVDIRKKSARGFKRLIKSFFCCFTLHVLLQFFVNFCSCLCCLHFNAAIHSLLCILKCRNFSRRKWAHYKHSRGAWKHKYTQSILEAACYVSLKSFYHENAQSCA